MKILQDKYFELNEPLDIELKISNNYNNIINEIRQSIAYLFTYYNDLIVKGEDNIIDLINIKITELKHNFQDNYFLNSLFIHYESNEKGKLIFGSRFFDENLIGIKDYIDEGDEDKYKKIAYHPNPYGISSLPSTNVEPQDLWYFRNNKELEDGFISFYQFIKEKELVIKDGVEMDKLFNKFNFKYSKHTKTYLKPIYIKGNFSSDIDYFNEFKLFDDIQKFIGKINGGLDAIANTYMYKSVDGLWWDHFIIQDKPFEIRKGFSIKFNDTGEELKINVFDRKYVCLSIDKTNTVEKVQLFLEAAYKQTKKDLKESVKKGVDNILMNFSSEESNIINQYNFLAYDVGIFSGDQKKYIEDTFNLKSNSFKYNGIVKGQNLLKRKHKNKVLRINKNNKQISINDEFELDDYNEVIYGK